METKDITEKIDRFINENRMVFTEKQKNTRHINIKLPDNLLSEIQQISYE